MPDQHLHTLNDCGCYARVYSDGSGVDIEHCNLHRSARELLEALQNLIDKHDEEPSMLTAEDWEDARQAVARARKH